MLLFLLACGNPSVPGDSPADSDSGVDSDPQGCPAPTPLAQVGDADDCPSLEPGLNRIEGDGFRYLLSKPEADADDLEALVFLPGGPADANSAEINYFQFLAPMEGASARWVVVPHTWDGSGDRAEEALASLAHFQGCYAHDTARVHLIGHSSGGRVAYPMGVAHPDPFRSMTGLPADFGDVEDTLLQTGLECLPVHHVVGADDAGWVEAAEANHARMESLGLDSTLSIVPDMGHGPNEDWDGSLLSDYWTDLD